MKLLEPIIVGDHTVTVSIEDFGHSVIRFTAVCGDTREMGCLNHQGEHDHSPEQLQHDVADFATRLAKLTAGRERSRILKASLFSGETTNENSKSDSSHGPSGGSSI